MIDFETLPSFKPCVVEYAGLRVTEMLLKDCTIVWHPYGPVHNVDLGYDFDGKLVGIRIWDLVANGL